MIQIFSDLDGISNEAVKIFVNLSKECISSTGRFVAALSGGSTPKRFYELLASDSYRRNVDWNNIHFFWVDERCVPKENEESNFRLAFDTLLSKVLIPAENIHRIKGEDGHVRGAQDYEDGLKNFFGVGLPIFDLILLGMGEDGHTASLFPGSKPLDEKVRFAVPVYGEKMNRITLTLPVLNNARRILFLVSGQSKADVLKDILENTEKRKKYPAGLISSAHGDITWLVTRDAAGRLKTIK